MTTSRRKRLTIQDKQANFSTESPTQLLKPPRIKQQRPKAPGSRLSHGIFCSPSWGTPILKFSRMDYLQKKTTTTTTPRDVAAYAPGLCLALN